MSKKKKAKKTTRKSAKKGGHKKKKAAKGKGHVPSNILRRRYFKLQKIVRSRGIVGKDS